MSQMKEHYKWLFEVDDEEEAKEKVREREEGWRREGVKEEVVRKEEMG